MRFQKTDCFHRNCSLFVGFHLSLEKTILKQAQVDYDLKSNLIVSCWMKIPMCVQYGWRINAVTGTQSVWTGTEATMLWLKTPSWEWLMIKWSMMVTKIQIILRIARGWFGSAHTWAHHCQAHMSSQLQPLSSRFLSCEGLLKKQLQERRYIILQNALNLAMIEKVRGDQYSSRIYIVQKIFPKNGF